MFNMMPLRISVFFLSITTFPVLIQCGMYGKMVTVFSWLGSGNPMLENQAMMLIKRKISRKLDENNANIKQLLIASRPLWKNRDLFNTAQYIGSLCARYNFGSPFGIFKDETFHRTFLQIGNEFKIAIEDKTKINTSDPVNALVTIFKRVTWQNVVSALRPVLLNKLPSRSIFDNKIVFAILKDFVTGPQIQQISKFYKTIIDIFRKTILHEQKLCLKNGIDFAINLLTNNQFQSAIYVSASQFTKILTDRGIFNETCTTPKPISQVFDWKIVVEAWKPLLTQLLKGYHPLNDKVIIDPELKSRNDSILKNNQNFKKPKTNQLHSNMNISKVERNELCTICKNITSASREKPIYNATSETSKPTNGVVLKQNTSTAILQTSLSKHRDDNVLKDILGSENHDESTKNNHETKILTKQDMVNPH